MSAAAKLIPLPLCGCGRVLDAGHCRVCEPVPVRISAGTTDREALLRGPELPELDGPRVITTEEGTITFRRVAGGVRVEIDVRGGAIAAINLPAVSIVDAVAAFTVLGRRAHWGQS